MTSTVIGLYDQNKEAHEVVHELEKHGFDRESIQCLEPGMEGTAPLSEEAGIESEPHDGIEQTLRTYGLPDDMARHYAEGVQHGGTLVAVRTPDDQAEEAANILDRYHPVDIEERARQWSEGGWVAHESAEPAAAPPPPEQPERAPEAPPSATTPPSAELRSGEEERIPVAEEQVKVGKRRVEGGGVRVYSHVTEHPVEEEVSLSEEHVDVERRKVDRPATEAEGAFQERTIEARESHEEPVVSKEARIIEEIVIGRETTEHTETIHDTARKTEVDIERTGEEERPDYSRSGEHESADKERPDYGRTDDASDRAHFGTAFVSEEITYEQAQPAYRFGRNLAESEQYRGREWSEIEPEAQRMFEARNPGHWDRFKQAVRHAYERTRDRL